MAEVTSTIVLLRPGLLAIAVILLGFASLNDVAVRLIPDRASIGLLAVGIIARLADGNALAALAASATVLACSAVCWRLGWLGGGDVKLLAACAWLVQPLQVPWLVLLTALAGGILACVYLVLGGLTALRRKPPYTGRPRLLAVRLWRVEWWRIRRRAALPYGCAIASATILTLYGR